MLAIITSALCTLKADFFVSSYFVCVMQRTADFRQIEQDQLQLNGNIDMDMKSHLMPCANILQIFHKSTHKMQR